MDTLMATAQHCASSQSILCCYAINSGIGTSYSLLGIVNAFEIVPQQTVIYAIAPRRTGDLAYFYASADTAKEQLGWQATRSLEDI
jgi:UDP-glucose 4-epimerase